MNIVVNERVTCFRIYHETDLMAPMGASLSSRAILQESMVANMLHMALVERPSNLDAISVISDESQNYNWPIFRMTQKLRMPTGVSCLAEIKLVLNDEAYDPQWEIPADTEVLLSGENIVLVGAPIVTNLVFSPTGQKRFSVDVLQPFIQLKTNSHLTAQFNLVHRGTRVTGENLYVIAINAIYIIGLSAGKQR